MKKPIALAWWAVIAAMGPQTGWAAPAPHSSALSAGEHEFRVADVRLWYRVAGRSSGVPLVFLHGGPGQGSQTFQAVGGPQLERSQRVIYFDQRGAGRSDRPDDLSKYSMAIMVEDVEHLRRHLGVPRIAILGHSFGTRLALEYAARYPQHIAAIVLAAAATDLRKSLDLQCERLAREDPDAFARAVTGLPPGAYPRCNSMQAYAGEAARAFARRNLFPDPAVADLVERLDSAYGLAPTGQASRALFQQGYLQYRFTSAAQVRAPVLIIAGGRDYQAALEPQRDLAAELPRARLLVYPRNGHFMFVEDPRRFARDVTSFLRRARRR